MQIKSLVLATYVNECEHAMLLVHVAMLLKTTVIVSKSSSTTTLSTVIGILHVLCLYEYAFVCKYIAPNQLLHSL